MKRLAIFALLCLVGSVLFASDPYDYKKTVQRRVAPVTVTHPIANRSLVDFGQEAFGFLEFTPPKGARGPYEVRLGEVKKADGSIQMYPGATLRAARIVGEIKADGVHRVPLVADRRNTNGGQEGAAIRIPAEHGVVMPFRYAEVFKAPFAISSDTVRMVAVEYPMDMTASAFTCDSPSLVKIYDLCKESIRATSFAGIYVDGDRERIPYEADAYLNQLGEYAVHADYSLGRASHEYLMKHPTWPTEWKQHSIKMAWADWMWSGDTRSLAKCYDQLKNDKLLERFCRASDGLLVTGSAANKCSKSNPNGARDIVDWPTGERDGYVFQDLNAVVNAFYYRNLLEMADIAKALGKTADAEAFAARAKKVYAAFQKVFFREKTGLYADGERTDHASLHANAAALAFGLVPKAKQAKVVEHLHSRGMACSVYFAQYLLEAFFEAGRSDLALELITAPGDRGWMHMLDIGSTITLEAWDVKYKPNLDWNHAWGTPPLNVISRYLLGVTPLEPGFAKINIAPQFGPLTKVHGKVPTAKGPVLIDWENGTLEVTTPAPARVIWGGKVREVPAGKHRFRGCDGEGAVATQLSAGGLLGAGIGWEASPISWAHDAKANTLHCGGVAPFAVAETPRSETTEFRVQVTPERAGTNGWATLALSLYDDERNFWHVALVRSPPEEGGRHWFELCEMREGEWLAQNADGLKCTERKQQGGWEYGQTYELSLKTTPAGIRGEVKDAQGKSLFTCAYAFPTSCVATAPSPSQRVLSSKTVTCGRFALHTTGNFKGTFRNASATAKGVRAKPAKIIPPYMSGSFVPGITDRATGFFHVVQKDGRWWVIDPKGRGTVLLGIDHVTYWGHYSQRIKKSHHHEAMKKKFPNKADWEEDTLRRLKEWGFNFLGAGCDSALQHRGMVHTIFLSIGDGLCWDQNDPEYFICPNEHRPCSAFPNVFHPDFARWADYRARQSCAPNRDDPWLFGYFIDNELAWWGRGHAATGLFDAVAKLPETHSARKAQRRFLAERGVTGPASDAVKLEFLRVAADIYFRVASEAIRRHDPNHLVMGARFAGLGGAHPAVWEISGKYCDVVTFNCYPWADLDRNVMLLHKRGGRIDEAFCKQYEYVKKPMLVTEWSFPALDSGLPCTGGAGQRFMTQTLRTQATELFAKTMLALPFLVGYDYFMWVDEPPEGISDAFPEDSNYGLINEKGEAYPEITTMFAKLHRSLGECRAAGVPAERTKSAPRRAAASTSAEQFARRLVTGKGVKGEVKDGKYTIRNGAGLEMTGAVGEHFMFAEVKLDGTLLGQYNGMVSIEEGGSRKWPETTKVVAAEWKDGSLVVTSEGWYGNDGHFALTHKLTPVADRPWFLCELVEAKNLGKRAMEKTTFYFREYSPFAVERAKGGLKSVPNLWKAPMHDAWMAVDGRYFGGASFAETATYFTYHLMDNNTSQHPDAEFTPQEDLAIKPGEVFRPQGTVWMVAMCGLDGIEGWKNANRQLQSANSR